MTPRNLEKMMKNSKEGIPELLSINGSERRNGKVRELVMDIQCKAGNPTNNCALQGPIENILFTKAIKNVLDRGTRITIKVNEAFICRPGLTVGVTFGEIQAGLNDNNGDDGILHNRGQLTQLSPRSWVKS